MIYLGIKVLKTKLTEPFFIIPERTQIKPFNDNNNMTPNEAIGKKLSG